MQLPASSGFALMFIAPCRNSRKTWELLVSARARRISRMWSPERAMQLAFDGGAFEEPCWLHAGCSPARKAAS